MAQEPEMPPAPTVTFHGRRSGLAESPQPLEVHTAPGDLKPWDLDSCPQFEQMGKPPPALEARSRSPGAPSTPTT